MPSPPPAPEVVAGPREGLGNVAVTTIQPAGARVFLWLRFKDPEGNKRDFPEGLPVRVSFTGGGTDRREACTLGRNGRLSFFIQGAAGQGWQSFTLAFPAGQPQYIVCEPNPAAPASGSPPAGSPPGPYPRLESTVPAAQERFFSLPVDFGSPAQAWGLKNSDWEMPASGDNRLRNATLGSGVFTIATSPPSLQDIGEAGKPVELTLDPHWKFFRFEFFDRYYGPTSTGSPPRPSHGGPGHRVSIPPVALAGYRERPDAPPGAPADAHSDWTVGANANNLLQCLPWIVRRDHGGNDLTPTFAGSHIGLRFATPEGSYVYSSSESAREIRQPAAADLEPGPDRLRYYHLPALWKSNGYYARNVGSPTSGKFFRTLTRTEIAAADARNTPLVFCLDDVVLTGDDLQPVALGANERVAVFYHRFIDGVAGLTLSPEGVWKFGNDPDPEGYHYSDIALDAATRYYIHDYPDWTRLVIAQGNLFDAFDERTPAACPVVGARAAVRWVDATQAPQGAAAGAVFANRPAATRKPFFTIQPFFQQQFLSRSDNPEVGPTHRIEWNTPYPDAGSPPPPVPRFRNARFDIAHLRCCDHDGANEIACLLRYHRLALDFEGAGNDGAANPFSAGGAASPPLALVTDRKDWARTLVANINRRWNSPDGTFNAARAWIVPRPASPPQAAPRIRTFALTFTQYLADARAHFAVRSADPGETSSMDSIAGTGQIRRNAVTHDPNRGLASAHEIGHCGGMPDDYRPSSNPHIAYNWNHVPGNPYEIDGVAGQESLMLYNKEIRARYFWYTAEWLHQLPEFSAVNFQVEHGNEHGNDRAFWLPHYPHANPGRHFVSWPVSFRIGGPALADPSYDAFVFMMGADAFTTRVLPGNMPLLPPDPRFDGMLVVLVRMRLELAAVAGMGALPAGPPLAVEAARTFQRNVRTSLYDKVNAQFTSELNFKRIAEFQLLPGSPPAVPAFRRCLLHFVPCFVCSGQPNAGWFLGVSRRHLRVVFNPGLALSFSAKTAGGPPTLEVDAAANFDTLSAVDRDAELDRWATVMFQAGCRTLGLSENANPVVAGSYAAANSYVNIVRSVMDNAAPNPAVT